MTATTDLLASLGENGWTAADGGGWRHDQHDITVRQISARDYTITTDSGVRRATSATGALCVVDAIIRGRGAAE